MVPLCGSRINGLSDCMIFLTICLHRGAVLQPYPSFLGAQHSRKEPRNPVLPHCPEDICLTTGVVSRRSSWQRCSTEVSTGCPVRVFALIQGELPDHNEHRVGVGRFLPWRSPTHTNKHPRPGCTGAASGSGSGEPCCLNASSAFLPGHSEVRSLPGKDVPTEWEARLAGEGRIL